MNNHKTLIFSDIYTHSQVVYEMLVNSSVGIVRHLRSFLYYNRVIAVCRSILLLLFLAYLTFFQLTVIIEINMKSTSHTDNTYMGTENVFE